MSLKIGQVAAEASVNVQTVRYYERVGMLPVPPRTAGGYRQYDADAVKRIRFIKHAQALGFSLREIRDLLALRVRHGAACATVERKARSKIALIDDKLRELARLRRTMEGLVASCHARKTTAECPVLEILEQDDDIALE
jgi:MerR family mercuric resistance operon transcriptional regulator/MerR family gold-responsive transcriptional activator of gol and ges genes